MTTTAGGDRPGDPTAAARDGVEAVVRPVLGARRGPRSQAGLVAVGVIAVSVVAAGIGFGGDHPEPGPSGGPSSATTDPSGVPGTRTPPPSRRPVPIAPYITPEVACAAPVSGSRPPRLSLAVGDRAPVPGVDLTTNPGDALDNGALVTGTFPESARIVVAGDACATSWSIDILEPLRGDLYYQIMEENPAENRDYISQNRIGLAETPLGASVVRATVRFGSNVTSRAAWELRIDGPAVPSAEFAGGGARVAGLPGCGRGWSLPDGRSAFELCSSMGIPETLELLTVDVDEVVTMDVPGWEVTSWSVACGTRWAEQPGDLDPNFNCGLGGWGEGTGPAGPARFLPWPGRWIVLVWVNAVRDDDSFYGQYLVEVDTAG
jgi:hypothetical protein